MSELLTPAELADLTGYRDKARQADELKRLGVPYVESRKGPRVSRVLMRERMLGKPMPVSNGPNFGAVR